MLTRKHNLPVEIVAKIFAPPFWDKIARLPENERELLFALRQVYGSLLMNGPFTIIIAHEGEMIGLTDRIRLRPLTVGTKKDMLYLSSEESAIRLICPDLDDAWIPLGGEPVIGKLGSLPQSRNSRKTGNTAKVK
jgi:glutamate synthase domain-containing protein 1